MDVDRIEAREKLLAALSGGPDLPPRDVDADIRELVRFIGREHKPLKLLLFLSAIRENPDSLCELFRQHRSDVQTDWFPLLSGIDLVREQVRDSRRRLNVGVYVTEDFRILFADRHRPNAFFELTAIETAAAFVQRWATELPRPDASDAELQEYLNWLTGIDFQSLERCLVAAEREFEAAFAGTHRGGERLKADVWIGPGLAKNLLVGLTAVRLAVDGELTELLFEKKRNQSTRKASKRKPTDPKSPFTPEQEQILKCHKPGQRHEETARQAGVFDRFGEPDVALVKQTLKRQNMRDSRKK